MSSLITCSDMKRLPALGSVNVTGPGVEIDALPQNRACHGSVL